ncbi:hypothetical protein PR202_gb20480 [Eleusine coracana subsp. coracana]|uniref:Uncharacterized protein n=1 Tax=Eleusine coracana subsp. coracana TaxID=191504 RepID=A0AAV5FAU1_ELECO|nr:hypothetical protein PR202_gb20480 [Eleusine coracana subsp. coracana]
MTPRAPPPRHHPPHLLLAEAVASWHPFQKKPCLSDRSTAPLSSALLPDAETPSAAPSGAAAADPFGGLGSASAGAAVRARGGGATDSSGEMWASDVGEVRMRDVPMAPEFSPAPVGAAAAGAAVIGAVAEAAAAESGYGSEPGYRGDVELGYGDEIDEEDDDGKQQLFWGGMIGGDERP